MPRMMNSTHGIATLFPRARYLAESEAPGKSVQPSGKPWSRSHSRAVSLLISWAINGAKNAAVLAAQILAVSDDGLAAKLDGARDNMAAQIAEKEAKLQTELNESAHF